MTIGLQFFSWRTSVYIGGLLTVTGYLVAAYANKLWILYLAFGAATGSFLFGRDFPVLFLLLTEVFNDVVLSGSTAIKVYCLGGLIC